MLRDGLGLVEQREAEDTSKLKALRAAARAGVAALDRGISRNSEISRSLSEKVISRTAE
ncbi:hypothetical protein [Bradyrhizobium sp. UFLA05-112]